MLAGSKSSDFSLAGRTVCHNCSLGGHAIQLLTSYSLIDSCYYYLQQLNKKTWALIMTLGVCYHASLVNNRSEYRRAVSECFQDDFKLERGQDTIIQEISR